MATTVHEHHTVPAEESSAAGWAALAIILLGLLIFGGLYFSGYFEGSGASDSNDINITLPETTEESSNWGLTVIGEIHR